MTLGLGLLVVAGGLTLAVGWSFGRILASDGGRGSGMAWGRLSIGAAAFIGAGMAQNLLVAPVALLIHGLHGIQPLVPSSVPEALYYGLAAGVAQEVAKLAGLQLYMRRGGLVPTAVAVGIGFALVEIVFVSLPGFSVPLAGPGALGLPLVERFAATLFHVGSALIICAGLLRGRPWPYLIAAILLHAVVDGSVGLMAVMQVHPLVVFEAANLVFSAVVLAVGIALVRVRGHRTMPEGEPTGASTPP